MTFVVTESCIKCKYADCVDVCPTLHLLSREPGGVAGDV